MSNQQVIQAAEQYLPSNVQSNEDLVEIPLWLVLELISIAHFKNNFKNKELKKILDLNQR